MTGMNTRRVLALLLGLVFAAACGVTAFALPGDETAAQTPEVPQSTALPDAAGVVPPDAPPVQTAPPAQTETLRQTEAPTEAPTEIAEDEAAAGDTQTQTAAEFMQANWLAVVAACVSVLALVLAIIALVRSGKNKGQRRRKNPYF